MFFFWSFTQSDCRVQIASASMLTQLLLVFLIIQTLFWVHCIFCFKLTRFKAVTQWIKSCARGRFVMVNIYHQDVLDSSKDVIILLFFSLGEKKEAT